MKPTRCLSLAAGVLLGFTGLVLAGSPEATERAGVLRAAAGTCGPCPAPLVGPNCYSEELGAISRVQGSKFFLSSVDFINNTTGSIDAVYQFTYSCAPSCGGANFFRTTPTVIALDGLGSFHRDDFIDYMNTQSLLQPGADAGAVGTLLVTFDKLLSCDGWEGNVVARNYNHIDQADPTSATVGFTSSGSLFFDSADTTLIGYARDTKSAPSEAGTLRSNLGVHNTDIDSTGNNVSLTLTFFDAVTGNKVGDTDTTRFASLQPGEVRQVSDIWATEHIPSTTNQVIVFVDNPAGMLGTTPTFEGFVTIIDGGAGTTGIATQDSAAFEMRCADLNLCGN